MSDEAAVNPYAPPPVSRASGEFHGDPFAAPGQYLPAPRGTRLLASSFDGMLLLALTIPGLLIVLRSLQSETDAMRTYGVIGGVVVAALAALALLSYQWYLVATRGQSLAKRWLGIRIVRLDGSAPGFVHGVVLRVWVLSAAGLVPFAGSLVGLADALAIFGRDSRCLHDYLAGTVVIQA